MLHSFEQEDLETIAFEAKAVLESLGWTVMRLKNGAPQWVPPVPDVPEVDPYNAPPVLDADK